MAAKIERVRGTLAAYQRAKGELDNAKAALEDRQTELEDAEKRVAEKRDSVEFFEAEVADISRELEKLGIEP